VSHLTRSDWGAKPAKSTTPMARPVSRAFVHHTAGDARTPPAQAVRNVQRQHQNDPKTPYSDIAYQELIAIDGTTLDGRTTAVQGGATKGHNATSLSWCLLGNFDTERPTGSMLEALAQRLALAVTEGRLTRDFVLSGHRDANSTACPGRYVMPHLTSVRSRVSEILTPTPGDAPMSAAEVAEIKAEIQKLATGQLGLAVSTQAPYPQVSIGDGVTYVLAWSGDQPVRWAAPGPAPLAMLVQAGIVEPEVRILTGDSVAWCSKLRKVDGLAAFK
jgi:N-acetylmuramoyl-L-alanine amidase